MTGADVLISSFIIPVMDYIEGVFPEGLDDFGDLDRHFDGLFEKAECDGVSDQTGEVVGDDPLHDIFTPLDRTNDSTQSFNTAPVKQSQIKPLLKETDLPSGPNSMKHSVEKPTSAAYTTPPQSKCPTPHLTTSAVDVEIPASVLLSPQSCYEPFEPPGGIAIVSEQSAVDLLLAAQKRQSASVSVTDSDEFQLNEFAIYCDLERFPEEMRSLHHLHIKTQQGKTWYFDGVLSVRDTKVYVRRVAIAGMPIGNHGTLQEHTVRGHVWLQSRLNFTSKRELYYRLGKPASEYARFFTPFLWVADLAKHFVDFLRVMGNGHRKVTIHHFRSQFATWLKRAHKNAPAILDWLHLRSNEDFRSSVVANIAFLRKEAIGVLDYKKTEYHTIWAEIWDFNRYRAPPQTLHPPTVVTQYIYDCFAQLPFGDRLKVVPMSAETKALRQKLIQRRHLELPSSLHDHAKKITVAPEQRIKEIKPGDTISTHRDAEGSGTLWRREISQSSIDDDRWFALVQKVHINKRGKRVFDVVWYYRPADTICGLMKYPWNNELFLSDHCSCSERSKIGEPEILGVHEVDFGGTSATKAEFFCRQTYVHEQRRWITLKSTHLHCQHTMPQPTKPTAVPRYQPGTTWLLHIDLQSSISEPCEFDAHFSEKSNEFYRFRRLLRRSNIDSSCPHARSNEVVYSEQFVEVTHKRIIGPCTVRAFVAAEEIPTPYDRNGVGNFFYITHQETFDQDGKRNFVPLEMVPSSLHQGYDPLQEDIPRLRGMDLFCGGGNFGRGLEDGGAIKMKWANDYDSKAIHTYMANVQDPEEVHPFLGSIDDLQRCAIEGKFSNNVPRIGDIDFISGGSPCPGFSRLTNDRTTIQQRKNQSLVAAFASFVDLYRPKYALLENVPGIIHKKVDRDQDVFSQVICALVGLGYQTQFFFMDASSCGASQRRSRIFVMVAAPGVELPQRPPMTHSHPPLTKSLTVGLLPTGEAMAVREMPHTTPFKFTSALEATKDLPPIYDGKPDICVPYPDHRVSLGITRAVRARICLIPKRPWGMNFAQAYYGMDKKKAGSGVLTQAEHSLFPRIIQKDGAPRQGPAIHPISANSGAYGRMFPNRLIETIVTSQHPTDAKNGRQLHWEEDRVLTIMEARRAQGFRDDDVLLGNPPTQYKIVGNSVAREVAVAFGVVIREAWVTSLNNGNILANSSAEESSSSEDVDIPSKLGSKATAKVPLSSGSFSDDEIAPTCPKRTLSKCNFIIEFRPLKTQKTREFQAVSPLHDEL